MTTDDAPVQPEVVDDEDESSSEGPAPAVTQPAKLMRIASMTRAMLEEVRQAPLDDAGRRRLLEIHEGSLEELSDVLSSDLQAEIDAIFVPISSETPTESELRIAQAQLVGWLEGLFAGIQASLWSQQAAAQAQLEEMRRRGRLEAGDDRQHGLYL